MNKREIIKTIISVVLTIFSYWMTVIIFNLINSKTSEGPNYGAIIFLLAIVACAGIIFSNIFYNIINIYNEIRIIIKKQYSKKIGIIICLIINSLLLIVNITYFVLLETKVFLK